MNPIEEFLREDEQRWQGQLVHLRRGARIAVYQRKRLSYRKLGQSLSFVCEGVSLPSKELESSAFNLHFRDERGSLCWARVEDVCDLASGPRLRPSGLAARQTAA